MNDSKRQNDREERPPADLDRWVGVVCAELGIDPAGDFTKAVLNLARVAAHRVDRPAAPLTAYLLGVAVGQGRSLPETAERLRDLARAWPQEEDHERAREG